MQYNWFMCKKVLPLVFDESISYYEQLCKMLKIINDLSENDEQFQTILKTITENLEKVNEDYNNFMDIIPTLVRINNYFLTSIAAKPNITFINDGIPNHRMSATAPIYSLNYNLVYGTAISQTPSAGSSKTWYFSIPLNPKNTTMIFGDVKNPKVGAYSYTSIVSVNSISKDSTIQYDPSSVHYIFPDDYNFYAYYNDLVDAFRQNQLDIKDALNQVENAINVANVANNKADTAINSADLAVRNANSAVTKSTQAINTSNAAISNSESARTQSQEAINIATSISRDSYVNSIGVMSLVNQKIIDGNTLKIVTKWLNNPSVEFVSNNERITIQSVSLQVNFSDFTVYGNNFPVNNQGINYITIPINNQTSSTYPQLTNIRNPSSNDYVYLSIGQINSTDGTTFDPNSLIWFFKGENEQ